MRTDEVWPAEVQGALLPVDGRPHAAPTSLVLHDGADDLSWATAWIRLTPHKVLSFAGADADV